MGIFWIILVGFVAGALAKYLMPGKDGGGFVMTTLLGIGGAFVGEWIGGMLGMHRLIDGLLGSILSATLGALLLLWIYNKWFKK
ncbi:MAG: GlsB/YeaQ/YmgE family stress response membrane protein [Bacteroidetes bacterium]|nr:GlsB/YeaQ/YmgE family stress response membrane protein [Bacteroidota bacterium]MDA1334060.1 GlsB/YeaQ/YmgE family stress response membrane protein [Bacteroidota bacterium]